MADFSFLYPFQRGGIDVGIKSIRQGRNILLSSPTGSGKSLIEIGLLLFLTQLGIRTYIVSYKKEILWGIEEKARTMFGVKISHLLWTPTRLLKRLKASGKNKVATPSIIIFDEAHHLRAPGASVLKEVAKLIGLTATPIRGTEDEIISWKSFFADFHSCISIVECILKGILVPFYIVKEHIGKIPLGDNGLRQLRVVSKNYIESNIEQIFRDIMKLDDRHERPTIFSTPNVTSSLIIKEHFEKRGMKIHSISKDTGKLERARYFEELANNEAWLAAIDILTEGIDIPQIARVVDLRPKKSPIPYVQLIGRGLRPSRDSKGNVTSEKQDCEIIDYSDNMFRYLDVMSDYLGISMVEDEIDGKAVYIPNLRDIRHPVNDYQSFKFSKISKYSKIKIKFGTNDFEFEIGIVELAPGRKRWFLSCKEGVYLKFFFYEHKAKIWKEIDIYDLNKYIVEYKDYQITNDDFDMQFKELLDDLIRIYAQPVTTVGLLLSISFLESVSAKVKQYDRGKIVNYLYYIHDELEVIDKWHIWLELLPKPTETESVFFDKSD